MVIIQHRLPSFCIFLLFLGITGTATADIEFRKQDYAELKKEALSERKLILIDFRADWCRPCIQMEKTTFKDSALSAYVNRQFISKKVDIDYFEGMDLKEQFRVFQYPTILIIEPEYEDVILRLIGFKPADIMEADLRAMVRPEFYEEYPDAKPMPIIDTQEAPEEDNSNNNNKGPSPRSPEEAINPDNPRRSESKIIRLK